MPKVVVCLVNGWAAGGGHSLHVVSDLTLASAEHGRFKQTDINGKSPTAQRMLKYSFNLIDDGLVGQQLFAGETTRLAYMTDEAQEGRDQFLEKRDPDWSPYPWYY